MVHIDKLHQPSEVLNIDRLLLHDPRLIFLMITKRTFSHFLQFQPISRELHELRRYIRQPFFKTIMQSLQLLYLPIFSLLIHVTLIHSLLKLIIIPLFVLLTGSRRSVYLYATISTINQKMVSFINYRLLYIATKKSI